MIYWNDNAPYEFLKDYGYHSRRLEIQCAAAVKRLRFLEVNASEIKVQKCKIFKDRINFWRLKYQRSKPIGTLFCRKMADGRWFLKDGNHRVRALLAEGEQTFRIAYDPEGIV